MAHYELQKWITGYSIRDTEDETYLRNSAGDVFSGTLGSLIDLTYLLNHPPASERERARVRFIIWNGDDAGFDAEYDAELAQEAYDAQWNARDAEDEQAWLDYCDSMGYDPNEYLDADAYSNLIMVRDSYI
jgi:hypothetical protein